MAALAVVRSTAAAIKLISSNVVHPVLFPYPIQPTIHAARISLIFRSQVARSKSKLSILHDLAGFLIMCWSGQFIVNMLLGLPFPPLTTISPWINYGAVHLAIYSLLYFVPSPPAYILDTTLPFIDAIARTAPIVGAIEAVRGHSNPMYSSSIFAQIALGTIACAANGVVASILHPWEDTWSVTLPPPFIKNGSILDTFDIWSGAIVSFIYIYLGVPQMDNSSSLSSLSASSLFGEIFTPQPFMKPLAARAAAVVVLSILYTGKAFYVHYAKGIPNVLATKPGSGKNNSQSKNSTTTTTAPPATRSSEKKKNGK